jgi:DNA-binding MarR family transcriptional regulator
MPADAPLDDDADSSPWQFLTNHTYVLLAIHRNPDIRQREIADQIGITEGAVQRIVHELEEAGCLRHRRVGRRNHYEVMTGHGLRHPIAQRRTIGEILAVLEN